MYTQLAEIPANGEVKCTGNGLPQTLRSKGILSALVSMTNGHLYYFHISQLNICTFKCQNLCGTLLAPIFSRCAENDAVWDKFELYLVPNDKKK